MLVRTMVIGILICSFWMDNIIAGSSFLSPEQPKMQRKVQQKPTTKFHRRDAEAVLDVHGSEIDGGSNDMEIKFNLPFEIGMKLSKDQYKDYGQALEKLLEDLLAEDNEGNLLKTIKTCSMAMCHEVTSTSG